MNVLIRPANPLDAGATGHILWQFQDDTDWMPKLYSQAETVSYCGTMIDRGWVTVAVVDGVVTGFLARNGAEILGLYLAPERVGQGIGRALLRDAKAQANHLVLRTFAANTVAWRFYNREGLVEVERGNGAENDEGLPDIAMRWQRGAAA